MKKLLSMLLAVMMLLALTAPAIAEDAVPSGVEDGVLTSGFPLGASNHFTGEEASISVKDGSLLVLWERKAGFPDRR